MFEGMTVTEALQSWQAKQGEEENGLKLNIPKTEIMASGPMTLWQIDQEKVKL